MVFIVLDNNYNVVSRWNSLVHVMESHCKSAKIMEVLCRKTTINANDK